MFSGAPACSFAMFCVAAGCRSGLWASWCLLFFLELPWFLRYKVIGKCCIKWKSATDVNMLRFLEGMILNEAGYGRGVAEEAAADPCLRMRYQCLETNRILLKLDSTVVEVMAMTRGRSCPTRQREENGFWRDSKTGLPAIGLDRSHWMEKMKMQTPGPTRLLLTMTMTTSLLSPGNRLPPSTCPRSRAAL